MIPATSQPGVRRTGAGPVGPKAGADYPTSLSQFLDWFHSDADCARYLAKLRWPDGFSCPKCGHDKAWVTKRYLYVCSACEHQTSLIAGTIFEKTRLPLLTWFHAIWMVTSSKSGVRSFSASWGSATSRRG